MYKNLIVLSSVTICCMFATGCAKTASGISTAAATESYAKPLAAASEPVSSEETATAPESTGFSMSYYTKAPNKNSSIKIEYPIFSGTRADELNALVQKKAEGFAQIDPSLFPADTGLTVDYQSAVTLQNSKIVSMIFWGSSFTDSSAYPTGNLIALNIDLQTMKEVSLKDLYKINSDFEKIFFARAFFPSDPITSYDEDSFPEMLKLQTPEYEPVDPFSIEDNVSCFLKPDGIVFSMPAVHATGSDHFEAQLKYEDIQQFYLPQENYWEAP